MTSPQHREARARLVMALVWAAVAAVAAAVLIGLTKDSPLGRTLGVTGGILGVAVLAGLVVAVVNGGLLRRPGRADLGGPAALALTAVVLCPVLTLALGLLLGRPYQLGQLALALVVTGLYAALALVAVATWRAARRPRLASAQP